MSGFKNLYALLGISPLAGIEQIRAALSQAAQNNKISLEDAQLVRQFLLNEETRKKYNAKLFAEYPEILQQMIDEKNEVDVNVASHHDEKIASNQVKNNKKHNVVKYFLLVAVILAVGSVPLYFYYLKPHMLFSKAEESVKLLLRSPEPVKFAKEKINIIGRSKYVCGMVDAKNVGGYGRYIFIYSSYKDNSLLIPSEKPEDEDKIIYYSLIWQVACNGMSEEKMLEWSGKSGEIRKEISKAQDKVIALKQEESMNGFSIDDSVGAVSNSWQKKIATAQKSVDKIKEKLEDHIKEISIYE